MNTPAAVSIPEPLATLPAPLGALLLEAWELRHADTRRALQLNEEAFALAWSQAHLLGLGYALLRLAVCNLILGLPNDLVRHQVDHGLQVLAALGDQRGLAEGWNLSANALGREGRYGEALTHQMHGLACARAVHDLAAEGTALGNVALYMLRLQRLPEALEMALEALQRARATADARREAYALSRIARVFESLGDVDLAVEYTDRCLRLLKGSSDRAFEATCRAQLARLRLQQGDVEVAAAHAAEALRLAQTVGNLVDRAEALGVLGEAALAVAAPALALRHLLEAQALLDSVGDHEHLPLVQLRLGSVHAAMSQRAEAVACWQRALAGGEATNDAAVMMPAHHVLAAWHEAEGQFELALKHLRAWSVHQDQLRGPAVQQRIREVLQRAAELHRL